MITGNTGDRNWLVLTFVVFFLGLIFLDISLILSGVLTKGSGFSLRAECPYGWCFSCGSVEYSSEAAGSTVPRRLVQLRAANGFSYLKEMNGFARSARDLFPCRS